MIEAFTLLAGFILLFAGGEILVKGSVSLARSFNISKLVISALIIGFGTSMPEMTVSVSAALKGSTDIALGNVVGSNIANILLIIGISALINQVYVKDPAVRWDVFWMIFSSILLTSLIFADQLNKITGTTLLLFLGIYLALSFVKTRKQKDRFHEHVEEDVTPKKPYSPGISILYCMVGILFLVIGANFLIDTSISIAREFGISEAIIGLTMIAVGSSLPELATAVIASMKKHSDVVIGNIVGSCIFNILCILGLTSIIEAIPVPKVGMGVDISVMLGATILLSVLLLKKLIISRLLFGSSWFSNTR